MFEMAVRSDAAEIIIRSTRYRWGDFPGPLRIICRRAVVRAASFTWITCRMIGGTTGQGRRGGLVTLVVVAANRIVMRVVVVGGIPTCIVARRLMLARVTSKRLIVRDLVRS